MFLFTFFSGEQRIACVNLEEHKEYTAGNSYDYDIFLPISNKSQNIGFSFHLSDNKLFFNNISSDLIDINRKTVTSETSYDIPSAFNLNLNQYNFMISLPTDNIVSYNDLIKALETNEDNLLETGTDSADIANTIETPLDTQNNDNNEDATLNPIKRYLKKITSKIKAIFPYLKPKTLMHYVGYGCVSIFIISIFTIFYISNSYSKPTDAPQVMVDDPIAKLLVKYPNLFISKIDNASLLVSGIVESQGDVGYIKNSLKTRNKTTFSLYTADKIREMLAGLDLADTIFINYMNNKINVTGVITNPKNTISKINDQISSILPVSVEVDNSHLFKESDVVSDLAKLSSEPTLNSKLLINEEFPQKKLTISGYLNNNESETLKRLAKPLELKYKDIINFEYNITDPSTVKLRVYEVYVSGKQSYIVTEKNQKVFVGGKIDNFILTAISNSTVVLKNLATDNVLVLELNNLSDSTLSTKQDSNNSSNSKSKPSSTNPILNSEAATLDQEKKYRNKILQELPKITDHDLKEFFVMQADNLASDIKDKEKELDYYLKNLT